jgi:endonuclease/exonuclease/phosphatase family metal-dependent hydrolase
MKFISRLVLSALPALTVICILLYLPACLVYAVSPGKWWPMGLLSIGFFYIWFALLLLLIVWLFRNKKTALLLFVLAAAGLPVIKNVVAIHSPATFTQTKKREYIRIMQWNCNGLQGFLPYAPDQSTERFKIVGFIKKYQPDIICIQDFSETTANGVRSNICLVRDTLGFPYFIYSKHYQSTYSWGGDCIGIAIFSKYPLTDSGRISYPAKKHPETILWANVKIGDKICRVATTHLQSMHLTRATDIPLGQGLWQDSMVINHGNMIEKLKYFQPYHAMQANYLRSFLDTCKMPLIFTADLNSVPSSYVYKKVRGNLADAFLAKSFGFGRSYHSLQPALRIDYIFYNGAINNVQTSLFHTTFSDHDPVLMDFYIP